MLTGVIQPLPRSRTQDRSDVAYPLWEKNPRPVAVDLPWQTASSFDGNRVRDLLSSATTAVLASSNGRLFQDVANALRPGMRVYAYGSPAIEADRALLGTVSKSSDALAVRLGFEVPADWLVVDGGRAGVLFVGPPGEEKRWAIPLEPPLARSLFEAFRVLFWFHSRREGLPDSARNFAFRPPLASPYRDPGKDVPLAAGRLVIDAVIPDLLADAEFRVLPDAAAGRTAVALFPPGSRTFEATRSIAEAGTRVAWTDCGLPRTSFSRQRLVMDLVTAPIGIQLEWGTGTAVDVFHRLNKACEQPQWAFHPQRRLRDVVGQVLLAGAETAAPVKAEERIDLPDVRVPLASFETAEPNGVPPSPPLARRITYAWRTVPLAVPVGAGRAQIIRQWTALDEWASRSSQSLRQRLDTMEGEERTFLDRLRGLLQGQDSVKTERTRIREALAELAEQPPSQRTIADATDTVRRLVEEDGKIRGLLQIAVTGQQKAEDEAEEATQHAAFDVRLTRATGALAERRAEIAALEREEAEAAAAVASAETALAERMTALREARSEELARARAVDEQALAEVRGRLKELDAVGHAPKEQRRPLTQEIQRLEGALAASKRALAAVEQWVPAPSDILTENTAIKLVKDRRETHRKTRSQLQSSLPALERATEENFVFRPGPRLAIPAGPALGVAPPVPSEAPPEVGELFEHQGQRYLAVKTWEQARLASRVAARLRAELVAFPDSTK